jgi:hypothetical protein
MNRTLLFLQWFCEPFTHDYTGNPHIEPAPKVVIKDPVAHLERCRKIESEIVIVRLRRLDGY